MIKDKITPELKARFIQEIHKTIRDGNEHGFLICHDNNGNLSPSKAAIGEKDNINFIDIKSHRNASGLPVPQQSRRQRELHCRRDGSSLAHPVAGGIRPPA